MGRPLLVLVAALALGSLVGEQASWTSSALVLLLSAALLALALAAPSAAAAYAVGAAAFGVGVAAAGAESLAYRDAPLLAWVDQYGGREAPVHVVATAYEDARVQGRSGHPGCGRGTD